MAKQLREIVPIKEGWPRAIAMGAAAAGAGALVGASSIGGAPIGAIPGAVIAGGAYLLSKHGARADIAKKSSDWNYGYRDDEQKPEVSKSTTTTTSPDPMKVKKQRIARSLALAEKVR